MNTMYILNTDKSCILIQSTKCPQIPFAQMSIHLCNIHLCHLH